MPHTRAPLSGQLTDITQCQGDKEDRHAIFECGSAIQANDSAKILFITLVKRRSGSGLFPLVTLQRTTTSTAGGTVQKSGNKLTGS